MGRLIYAIKRRMYALRFMAWAAIWYEHGPDKPFEWYMKRYDRRQELLDEPKCYNSTEH